MTTASPPLEASAAPSPLEAFTGDLVPTRTSLLYRIGLGFVAFAMVLLPAVYISLIALTAWGVLLHLRNDTWIMDGGGNGRGKVWMLIAYLAPAVAGGILVFFMVKPFFAKGAKAPELLTLDPAKEPLLFRFVEKICQLIGAPIPGRIQVDCQVNASASLAQGLWSKELVLTLGLPLASGLTMRQFAGVLAHEFGHFAQGAGMRLTYVIRTINHWFARVVYERDEWDLKLEQTARNADFRFGIMWHLARGCVWITRRILWALMIVGHGISCFMLRQMEYDADSYEAKLAGSDAFESTATRLRLLHAATEAAYGDVRQTWASNRLPESLPLLIQHRAASLPTEVHQKLTEAAESARTKWADTHPCDTDRVRAVRALHEPGIFTVSATATELFSNFEELGKAVTKHQYTSHLELEFTESSLISTEEMVRESSATAQTAALIRKFYGAVNISLQPLLTGSDLTAGAGEAETADAADTVAQWRAACRDCEALRAHAEKLSEEWAEFQRRGIMAATAHRLTLTGFSIPAAHFGLPESATTVAEQETAARIAVEEYTREAAARLSELDPFMNALRRRVSLSLRAVNPASDGPSSDASPGTGSENLTEYSRLLAATAAEMSRVHEIAVILPSFTALAQNYRNHSDPAMVERAMDATATKLQTILNVIQEHLRGFTYPFPHARGTLSVADYARDDKEHATKWQQTFADSQAHVDRLFALHYRLLGQILQLAEAAEEALAQDGRADEASVS